MFKSVNSKKDFVKRYAKGEFGNCSPTWLDLHEWFYNGTKMMAQNKLYHIRNRVKGGPTYYDLNAEELVNKWQQLIDQGVPKEDLYISEMCPTEKTLFQGEVSWMDRAPYNGLELTFTTVPLPMREAFKESVQHVHGIAATETVKYYMDSNSYAWLQALLSRYPNHVIEFSTFNVKWGTLEGYNTVFWEVRNY